MWGQNEQVYDCLEGSKRMLSKHISISLLKFLNYCGHFLEVLCMLLTLADFTVFILYFDYKACKMTIPEAPNTS